MVMSITKLFEIAMNFLKNFIKRHRPLFGPYTFLIVWIFLIISGINYAPLINDSSGSAFQFMYSLFAVIAGVIGAPLFFITEFAFAIFSRKRNSVARYIEYIEKGIAKYNNQTGGFELTDGEKNVEIGLNKIKVLNKYGAAETVLALTPKEKHCVVFYRDRAEKEILNKEINNSLNELDAVGEGIHKNREAQLLKELEEIRQETRKKDVEKTCQAKKKAILC